MSGEPIQPWPANRRQAMSMLVSLFPTLCTAEGVNPWSATEFVRWAALHGHCSGSAHAVRFVLSVWNANADWREILKEAKADDADRVLYLTMQQLRRDAAALLAEQGGKQPTATQIEREVNGWLQRFGPFNLADAVSVWDRKHRAAVSAWIADPFWP